MRHALCAMRCVDMWKVRVDKVSEGEKLVGELN